MKGALMLGLLSATASAAAVDKRQFPNFLSFPMEKEKAYKIEQLKPQILPEAKRVRIIYGPYKINPADKKEFKSSGFSMDPHGTGYMSLVDDDFPRDITVLQAHSEAVDENFKRTDTGDGLYNHHNVFFDSSKTTVNYLGCNGKSSQGSPVNVLMGGATELTTSNYFKNGSSIKSGYYIAPQSKIVNVLDMVNYKNMPRTVYTVSDIEYLPGKQEGWLNAQTSVINLGMCDGTAGFGATNIHAPKGVSKFTLKTEKPIEVTRDCYLISASGHLHDGGISMHLSVNGKEVCVSKAIYGGPGHTAVSPDGKEWTTIANTSPCPDIIKLNKGDKLNLEAKFDFDAHPARQSAHGEEAEGMALVTGTFAYL